MPLVQNRLFEHTRLRREELVEAAADAVAVQVEDEAGGEGGVFGGPGARAEEGGLSVAGWGCALVDVGKQYVVEAGVEEGGLDALEGVGGVLEGVGGVVEVGVWG